jgi:hypothetical protein
MSDFTFSVDDINTIVLDAVKELEMEVKKGTLAKAEVPAGKKMTPDPAINTPSKGDNKRGSMPKGNMLKGEVEESDGASGVDGGPLLPTKGGTSKNGSGPTNTTGPLLAMAKADGDAEFAQDEESGPAPSAEDGSDAGDSAAAPAEAAGGEGGEAGPSGEPMGDVPEETIEDFYASLDDDALRMHWEALKAVIVAKSASGDGDQDDIGSAEGAPMDDGMGAAQDGGADMASAPGAEQASMDQPPMEDPTNPTMKSEDVDQGVQMSKSEVAKWNAQVTELRKSLEAKTAELTNLKADFTGLADLVKNTFTTPGQKAITAVPLTKSETAKPTVTMSRTEIKTALDKVVASGKPLNKSERNSIASFYLNGSDFDKIKHLLDETK